MAPTATEPTLPPAHLAAARRRIAAATRALALTHIAPDGDAVGSLLGFGLGLRALGKDVTFACADPIPDTFRFLTSAGEITHAPRGEFDLIVSLDAADLGRLGVLGEKLPRRPDIVFDHHLTNGGFADLNLIDVQTASTAELVTELLEPLGLPLTLPMAEALLTGIINDTLGFRTSNTSAKSLAMAQKLMAAGANLGELYDRSFYKRSFYAVRFWGEGLINIRLEDRIVWATLTLEARKKAGYTGNGDADLINVLNSVREADVAVVFVERSDGKVKISWRASPGLNVAELAAAYGGGGHAPASGAEVTGTLAEVEQRVIAATKALLKSKVNSHQ
jgi:phosphoesterase RecJ-like protein